MNTQDQPTPPRGEQETPRKRKRPVIKYKSAEVVREEQLQHTAWMLGVMFSEQTKLGEVDLRIERSRSGDILVQAIRWADNRQYIRGLVYRREDYQQMTLINLFRSLQKAHEVPHGWISEEEHGRHLSALRSSNGQLEGRVAELEGALRDIICGCDYYADTKEKEHLSGACERARQALRHPKTD
jgi:hypothetical protein